jgi:uncharacterized delta-60 repeat protein
MSALTKRATHLPAAKGVLLIASFVTLSCHAQLGTPLWTNRFNGPGNSWDVAYAAATDRSGNLIIGGYSRRTTLSGSEDFLTIKYSNAGVPLWTNRYNGPADSGDYVRVAACDDAGNVYVTGHSVSTNGGDDIVTIKYSASGIPVWTNRYDGPGHSYDRPYSVVAHSSGRIYVGGYSHGGSSYSDFLVLAYASDGIPLWTNHYDGPVNDYDEGYAMAVSDSGTVFITGWSFDVDWAEECVTLAYSATGTPLWTNKYDGPASGADAGSAVASDYAGNAAVAVWSRGVGTGDDFAVVKYSATGLALWTNRYNGPANGNDFPAAVGIDASGNVFVTGYSPGVGTGNDYATVKYSSSGVPLWTNRYNGPGNSTDEPRSLVLDNHGNVIVTGFSQRTASAGSEDYATIAYSNNGIPLWTNRYNGPGNDDDRAFRVVAANGSVFVIGYSTGSGTSDDYAAVRYAGPTLSPIPLALQRSGNQLMLSWTNPVFRLQSSAAPNAVYTYVPGAVSPFTNSITGGQKYFRLREN